MPPILPSHVAAVLDRASRAPTAYEKGKAFEDLICYIFSLVPGIEIVERNALNEFHTEEIDVALWNDEHADGFRFLPTLLLVECKNWSAAVGSQEVAYFAHRLRQRGCDHGFLIAANGVTGNPHDLTQARFQIASALSDGIRIMVITNEELVALEHTADLVALSKRKLCQLVASGTAIT